MNRIPLLSLRAEPVVLARASVPSHGGVCLGCMHTKSTKRGKRGWHDIVVRHCQTLRVFARNKVVSEVLVALRLQVLNRQ